MDPSPQLPPFHQTFIPILKELADGSLKDRKTIGLAVREEHYADLPKELLQEKTTTGGNRLLDRIGWAISYLNMAGYLEKPERGQYRITEKGRTALKAGQLSLAELKKQPEFRVHSAEDFFQKGLKADQSGAFEEAIDLYSKAIDLNPNYALAYMYRGIAKAELKQYNAALADYDRAIELDPKYAEAYVNRGNAKFFLKQYAEAISDFDRAIELNSKYALAYMNRGNVKEELKQYDAAIADLNRAIELDPKYAEAYVNRGYVKADLKQYDAAIADYDRAIKLDSALAYFNRGMVYRKLGQEKKAIEDFKEAQKLDPTIISKEEGKLLEEQVKEIGEKTKEVEDFQRVLTELEEDLSSMQKSLGWRAFWTSLFTVGIFFIFSFEQPACWFEDLESSKYLFWRVSSFIAFFVALSFYALGQYTKLMNLRIDARNRLAMAKLLAHIDSKQRLGKKDWHSEAYSKLIDAIAYRIEFKKPKAGGEPIIKQFIDGVTKKD